MLSLASRSGRSSAWPPAVVCTLMAQEWRSKPASEFGMRTPNCDSAHTVFQIVQLKRCTHMCCIRCHRKLCVTWPKLRTGATGKVSECLQICASAGTR